VLGPLQDAVLAAGDDTGVYRFDRIDSIGYERERDGFIGQFLMEHPDRPPWRGPWWPNGYVLALAISGQWAEHVTSTLLTFNSAISGLRHAWVDNMDAIANEAALERAYVNRPFHVTYDLEWESYSAEVGLHAVPPLALTDFGLSTDIWFPWTSGLSHGRKVLAEPLDNRVLAAYNAPRLNEFLRRVRETAVALGGTWSVQAEQYASQVDERGVILDAPRPTWHQHPRP
jgi:hypothetical protein